MWASKTDVSLNHESGRFTESNTTLGPVASFNAHVVANVRYQNIKTFFVTSDLHSTRVRPIRHRMGDREKEAHMGRRLFARGGRATRRVEKRVGSGQNIRAGGGEEERRDRGQCVDSAGWERGPRPPSLVSLPRPIQLPAFSTLDQSRLSMEHCVGLFRWPPNT